ncbi:MAG: hypothetical protein QOE90_849 [Thermoplasmata archaeon]|jgi:hypothetical protein|nr:hypothetical protein [Thermoplasmata archaeon]
MAGTTVEREEGPAARGGRTDQQKKIVQVHDWPVPLMGGGQMPVPCEHWWVGHVGETASAGRDARPKTAVGLVLSIVRIWFALSFVMV